MKVADGSIFRKIDGATFPSLHSGHTFQVSWQKQSHEVLSVAAPPASDRPDLKDKIRGAARARLGIATGKVPASLSTQQDLLMPKSPVEHYATSTAGGFFHGDGYDLPIAVAIPMSLEERSLSTEERAADIEAAAEVAEREVEQSNYKNNNYKTTPMKKTHWYSCIGLLCLIVWAAAVSGFCGATGTYPKKKSAGPPLTEASTQNVLEYINAVTLTGPRLNNPHESTPEGRALRWLNAPRNSVLKV
jgi:hypothetical protein